jgi:hypothetical protein
MVNRLRGMGVPRDQVSAYMRRVLRSPDRPLSVQTIREMSDFLSGFMEIPTSEFVPQPDATTGIHSTIIPNDTR